MRPHPKLAGGVPLPLHRPPDSCLAWRASSPRFLSAHLVIITIHYLRYVFPLVAVDQRDTAMKEGSQRGGVARGEGFNKAIEGWERHRWIP